MNEITQETAVMKVEFNLSRKPESFCSIKVGGSFPVFIKPKDNLAVKLRETIEEIKKTLHEEVDTEFESYGHKAPYSNEARGYLMVCQDEKMIVLSTVEQGRDNGWKTVSVEKKGHRLSYLRRYINEHYPNYTLFDRTKNGDDLPLIDWYEYEKATKCEFIVFKKGDDKFPEQQKWGYWESNNLKCTYSTGLEKVKSIAKEKGLTIFDCTDSDFSKLPPPNKAEKNHDERGIQEDEIPF